MSHLQAESSSDEKDLVPSSAHSEHIILTQGVALSTLNPSELSTSAWVIDYWPVDNHRALLNRWRELQPAQQLIFGGCLGLALGWGFITWITARQDVTALAPSRLSQHSALALTSSTFTLLHQHLGASSPMVNPGVPPETTTPVSAVRPSLHPVMVDRYYLPLQAVFPGQGADSQSAIVVDRFYFDRSTVADTKVMGSPNHQDAQPLMVPLPPPSPAALTVAQGTAPSAPTSALPAVHQRSPASPAPSQAVAVVAPSPKLNRLLGVIQTGQFSAALIQTGQNSYAVRLGDYVSQSAWQLVEIQSNAVIINDGQERHLIHVGDMF